LFHYIKLLLCRIMLGFLAVCRCATNANNIPAIDPYESS
jgi:hypothetical protein